MKRFAVILGALLAGLAIVTPAAASGPNGYYIPPVTHPPVHPAPAPGYHSSPPPTYHSSPPPTYHSTPPPANTVTPAPRAYTGNPVTDAIATAAARWGVSYDWLLRVAECESGLNPNAYNPSGASGLFQFMPGTYWAYAARIGETRSYWDPYGASNVAAYMFSVGLSSQWACR